VTPEPAPPLPVRWTRLSEHLYMVLIAIVCGAVSALGAVAFRFMIRAVQDAAFGHLPTWLGLLHGTPAAGIEDPVAAAPHLPWFWKLVVPALGAAVAAPLIYSFAREAKGHGVPEVMESIALRGGAIRPRVVVVKAVASAFSIGSGGSVGREGPIVQIGAALGSTLGQLLRLPGRQLRTLVGCGAAAGIAAAFNAPIGGALFAVEIILGDFAVPQFSPIVIASVVATVVSRLFLGDFPAFIVPGYRLVSPFELLPYMVLGALAGLVGVCFIVVLYACEDFFDGLAIPNGLKLPIGGLVVGATGIFLPQVYGVGYSTINAALVGSLPLLLLAVLLPAKIAATSVTLGSGGSGGIFAPSLFLGAVTGGCFGTVVHQLFPAATASSGAYALVTMGAVVAATTHAPITAIIIIFELTKDITIVPPLMAACVISTLVASFLKHDSIYTLKLRRHGIDLFAGEEPNVLKTLFVRDLLDREPDVIRASAGFPEVLDLVVRSEHSEFFVVDDHERLLGAISVNALRRLVLEQDTLRHLVVAADLVDSTRPTVTENDDLDLVLQLLSRAGVGELAVVDPTDPLRLVGSIHERGVIEAYNQEVLRRDLAGGVTSRVTLAGRGHRVGLGGGYVVAEVQTPRSFVGRTLRELDLRVRMGVEVLLVRPRVAAGDAPAIRIPRADDRIAEADVLVVAGAEAAIDRLDAL
jgi:CIC family chloride channel protein